MLIENTVKRIYLYAYEEHNWLLLLMVGNAGCTKTTGYNYIYWQIYRLYS